jgi:hypothetical protein
MVELFTALDFPKVSELVSPVLPLARLEAPHARVGSPRLSGTFTRFARQSFDAVPHDGICTRFGPSRPHSRVRSFLVAPLHAEIIYWVEVEDWSYYPLTYNVRRKRFYFRQPPSNVANTSPRTTLYDAVLLRVVKSVPFLAVGGRNTPGKHWP